MDDDTKKAMDTLEDSGYVAQHHILTDNDDERVEIITAYKRTVKP